MSCQKTQLFLIQSFEVLLVFLIVTWQKYGSKKIVVTQNLTQRLWWIIQTIIYLNHSTFPYYKSCIVLYSLSFHLTQPEHVSPYMKLQGARGHAAQKKSRSLLQISGECRTWPTNEDTAVLVWELKVSQERRVMRPRTHDSVCLVSDTERQPIWEAASERKGKEKGKAAEGQEESGWVKDAWWKRKMKGNITDRVYKEVGAGDSGRTRLNTLQAVHRISQYTYVSL